MRTKRVKCSECPRRFRKSHNKDTCSKRCARRRRTRVQSERRGRAQLARMAPKARDLLAYYPEVRGFVEGAAAALGITLGKPSAQVRGFRRAR